MTGKLKTRPGDAGGLAGGEATELAYDSAIRSTMAGRESKGLSDSVCNAGNGVLSESGRDTADMICSNDKGGI